MRRFIQNVIFLTLLGLSVGCISAFTPIDSNFKPKGKTLAVIAALENKENVEVAYHMTEALKKNTRFQVMSQKQVAQTLSDYPSKIQGPFRSAYFEIETDYSKTDIKKIRAIQKRLGSDYLYVIWTPSRTIYNRKMEVLNIVAQMFEAPSSKEVGNGKFGSAAGHTDCCLVPAPGDEDRTKGMKDTSEYVARQIGEKTGMLRQQR